MASPAYERRNARARALGYADYYDYRAHGNGARAPSEPRLRGDELERARGHRGSADLERELLSGRVELVNVIQTGPNEVEVLVTRSDGSTKSYTVKGEGKLRKVRGTVDRLGPAGPKIVGSPGARKRVAAEEELEADEARYEDEAGEEQTEMGDDEFPF